LQFGSRGEEFLAQSNPSGRPDPGLNKQQTPGDVFVTRRKDAKQCKDEQMLLIAAERSQAAWISLRQSTDSARLPVFMPGKFAA
jgi:hypothetical protein